MPYDLHWPNLKAKMNNRVCKQCGIYDSSIAADKRLTYDDCGLEVLGNKLIDEKEATSHEEEENLEILLAHGDDDHANIINIYELLMNSEFIN